MEDYDYDMNLTRTLDNEDEIKQKIKDTVFVVFLHSKSYFTIWEFEISLQTQENLFQGGNFGRITQAHISRLKGRTFFKLST